jgi:glycosyltransferase involved in cell wall biosynthesis
MPSMKLLVICGAGIVSGKEIMTLQLLESLKERGWNCHCITSPWGSRDFKARLKAIGVPYTDIRIGFISKTFSWRAIRMTLHQAMYVPKMLLDYRRIVKNEKPDVVLHTNFHHLFTMFPAVDTKRTNIYWSHEFAGTSSFYQRLFRLFDRKIKWFVGVSGAIGKSLEALVGKEKVVVIRNGLKSPLGFQKKTNRNTYPVIGIIGQVIDHKGHSVLMNALKDFRTWKYKPSVVIIGSGDPNYIEELQKLAKDLSIDEIIEWKGFVSATNEIYEDLDFIVVPTKLPDPYPTVVMEAGFRGVPAIVSDSGGLPEMVIPGVNGMVFKMGDANSLAACLATLPSETGYAQLSTSTNSHASEYFALRKFVDSFEKLMRGKIGD